MLRVSAARLLWAALGAGSCGAGLEEHHDQCDIKELCGSVPPAIGSLKRPVGLLLATVLLLACLYADRRWRRQRQRRIVPLSQRQQQAATHGIDPASAELPDEQGSQRQDSAYADQGHCKQAAVSSVRTVSVSARTSPTRMPSPFASAQAPPFSPGPSPQLSPQPSSQPSQPRQSEADGPAKNQSPPASTSADVGGSALARRASPPHLSTMLDQLPFLTKQAQAQADAAAAQAPGPARQQHLRAAEHAQAEPGSGRSLPHTPRAHVAQSDRATLDQLRSELSSLASQPIDGLLAVLQSASLAAQQGAGQEPSTVSVVRSASQQRRGSFEEARLSEWEVSPHELEICRRADGSLWQIGAGGFGRVYKGMRFGVQPVAVKVLAPTAEARYSGHDDFVREMELLKACKDVNIVSFLGASLSRDFTMLVLELCEGGALSANLRAGRIGWFKRGKQVALDVARGLAYLHGRRLIHLDLKSSNILLDRHGHAKIADMGLAKILTQELSAVTANVGTLDWAAPEVLLGQRCTEKADIYSFGVCLWEIASREVPTRGRMRALHVPQDCPAEVATLVEDCMASDPASRPSAQQLVERLMRAPATTASTPVGSPEVAVAQLQAGATPPRPPRSASLAALSLMGGQQAQQQTQQQAQQRAQQAPQQQVQRAQQQQVEGVEERGGGGPVSQSPAGGGQLSHRRLAGSPRCESAGSGGTLVHRGRAAGAAGQGQGGEIVRALSSPPELHVHGDVYGLGI